jgi:hypothetical protein
LNIPTLDYESENIIDPCYMEIDDYNLHQIEKVTISIDVSIIKNGK